MSELKPLGAIVGRERGRIWKTNPGLELQSLWEKAVGSDIARHTRVWSLRRGVLTVGCSSGAWALELRLSAQPMAERINRMRPAEPVREIRFVHQSRKR